jgi:ribosome-binding protein aMBF1 (putative translation factor)
MPEEYKHCMNPWKKDCQNTDVAVFIQYEGQSLPICSSCWDNLGESNRQWSSDGKPNKNTQLSDEQRKAISDRMKLYRLQHPEITEKLRNSLKEYNKNNGGK